MDAESQKGENALILARDLMAKRILIVEDNPDNRILVLDMVLSLGYEVLIAEDGEEAIARTIAERPDLVLMDLSLPKKNGWTAVREMKAMQSIASIPVIALTAHAMVGDREKALQAGCDDYISKPIDMCELTSKLAHFLGSAAP